MEFPGASSAHMCSHLGGECEVCTLRSSPPHLWPIVKLHSFPLSSFWDGSNKSSQKTFESSFVIFYLCHLQQAVLSFPNLFIHLQLFNIVVKGKQNAFCFKYQLEDSYTFSCRNPLRLLPEVTLSLRLFCRLLCSQCALASSLRCQVSGCISQPTSPSGHGGKQPLLPSAITLAACQAQRGEILGNLSSSGEKGKPVKRKVMVTQQCECA